MKQSLRKIRLAQEQELLSQKSCIKRLEDLLSGQVTSEHRVRQSARRKKVNLHKNISLMHQK